MVDLLGGKTISKGFDPAVETSSKFNIQEKAVRKEREREELCPFDILIFIYGLLLHDDGPSRHMGIPFESSKKFLELKGSLITCIRFIECLRVV